MFLIGGSFIRTDSEIRTLSITNLPSSRDMKSYVSSIGGRERETDR